MRAEGLGREFAHRGHEVWLAGPGRTPGARSGAAAQASLRWLGAPGSTRGLLLPAGFSPTVVLATLASLRTVRPHIVHSFGHRPAAFIPAWYLQNRRHATHVADWADWWGAGGIASERGWLGRATVGAVDGVLERWSRQSADGLTVATTHLATLARGWGIPAERLQTLAGGARVDAIQPIPMKEARLRHGVDAEHRILVHAGQSAFDLDFLMDCFAEVLQGEPRARLLVIGGSPGKVARHARWRGLSAQVILRERLPIEQLGALLACGDVMLLPFPRLGLNLGRFPNRLGDYLSTGRPVVTNATGDVGRLITEHGIGLAAEPDPHSTAQAALQLLSDSALADQLGRRGRAYAEQHLAWPVVANEVMAFYERLRQRVEYPR